MKSMEAILPGIPIPKGAKLLICGGRYFKDKRSFWTLLKHLAPSYIVTGGQGKHNKNRGADLLAEEYAKEHGIPLDVVHALWEEEGLAAGPIRNLKMLRLHPDIEWTVAMPGWKGTADMIKRSVAKKIPTLIFSHDYTFRVAPKKAFPAIPEDQLQFFPEDEDDH